MTSKKSFLVDLKTNARRRIWLAVVMFTPLFFFGPIFTAMMINMEKIYYPYKNLGEHLGQVFAEYVGLNVGNAVLISFLAVFAAIQGFGYMYQKQKLDMYMSVPVKKGRRFAAIYINSVLCFLISYGVNLCLNFMVAGAMGVEIGYAVTEGAVAFACNTLLFLAVYNMGILAVMLTGNMIISIMASLVLLLYDGVVIAMVESYMSGFFVSYHLYSSKALYQFQVTPFIRFIRMVGDAVEYFNYAANGRKLFLDKVIEGMVPVVIVGVIAFALGYFCYTRKPSEACGKAIAFPKVKGVLKVFIIVPVALLAGIAFYQLSGRSKGFLVLGLLAGILLCHAVIEVIYDFDIRSVVHGWKTLLISAGGVTVISCIFIFDLSGYDRYVPRAEALDSLAFHFSDEYGTVYDKELNDISRWDYIYDNMKITNVEPVLVLADRRMGENRNISPDNQDANTGLRGCDVMYRLKNGKKVYRTFNVRYMEDLKELDELTMDSGYKESTYSVYNEDVFEAVGEEFKISYDNGEGAEEVQGFTVEQFRDAYKKDLANLNYTVMTKELATGKIGLNYKNINKYIYLSMPVFPSFKNTIALLEPTGMCSDVYVPSEKIERVIIRNENTQMYKNRDENAYGAYEDYSVEEIFESPEEIREIAEALYPADFSDWWRPEDFFDNNFYVTVIYKSEYAEKKGISTYMGYLLQKDKIPEYVMERTAYQGASVQQ